VIGVTPTSVDLAQEAAMPSRTRTLLTAVALGVVAAGAAAPAAGAAPLGQLSAVRAGQHPGFDRLVYEFSGPLPTDISVGYVPVVREGGSGTPIPVAGAADLEVRLDGAENFRRREARPNLRLLTEVKTTTHFEAQVISAVGVRYEAPFRVFTLGSPSRVVIDFTPRGLVGIRAAHHPGFDRVVWEFDTPTAPARTVQRVGQVLADPSGLPIPVAGNSFLQVAFHGVTRGRPLPSRLPVGLPTVREIVLAGDFEGVVSYGLGLQSRAGYRLLTLTNPSRVVLDVVA
jgi:hypothetical protein